MIPISVVLSLAMAGEVLTQHNDNGRSGAYNVETSLISEAISGSRRAAGYRVFALELGSGKVVQSAMVETVRVCFYVFAYRASDLHLLSSICTSCANAESKGNAIWQAGNGLSADGEGAVYAITGNGTAGSGNFRDSFLKFGMDGERLRVFYV